MSRLYLILTIGIATAGCTELDIKRVDAEITSISPDAAVPGSTITIMGSNFTTDAVVSFGNTEAEIISVESNQMEIRVPTSLSPSSTVLKIDAQGAPASINFEVLPFFAERTRHPDNAFDGTGFVLNDVLYFGMGGAPWYQYNANSDTWTPMTANNAGPNKYGAIGIAINGKGYVLGVGTDNELWEYNPSTQNWTMKSEYPNNQLLIPAVFAIGTNLYLATGYHDGITNEVWKYSTIDDEWTQINNFAGVKRGDAVGFEINGTGYVGQGYDFDTNSLLNDFFAYNTTSDTWTEISAPLNPSANLEGGVGFSLGGKGYIGLGRNGNVPVKDFWKYNPADDSWLQFTTYPGNGVMEVQAFVVGNKVYLINGSSEVFAEDYVEMWEFTPETF
ncbi:MAG: IPT/TIG domain-containing protein [Cyclobacteriaceae bacterium]|nr:IPT/TIG domain-containing protein [Cyclobacteriaceae bacterium SS2]